MASAAETRPHVRWIVIGFVAAAVGFSLTPILALFTVFSVNACGPFADGCDEYGQTAPGFELYAAGTLIALVVAIAGLIVGITAAVRHRRRINY